MIPGVGVYDLEMNLISDHIHDAIPGWDSIKIKNRLIDGSYHIQNVGEPARTLNVIISCDRTGVETLDYAEAISKPIKVVVYGKEWTGFIDAPINWQRVTVDYYRGEFLINVISEVVL